MSKNQLHGKEYENHIKLAFPGVSDEIVSSLSKWDIDAKYDYKNLPTSIKSSAAKGSIELSDARRFWGINEPFRLILGIYDQINNVKYFNSLHEFEITHDEHKILLGNITYDEISKFHESLKEFELGDHDKARKYAHDINKNNFKKRSVLNLNPKIDSKTQRRLQCSINFSDLINNVKNYKEFKNNDTYRNICINFILRSSKREFSK